MCAIAGIWRRDGGTVDAAVVTSMLDCLEHRGPDGSGYHFDAPRGIALGHRRLAIIDPSDDAMQPAWLPDQSLCMLFNGEIHNYLELAAELRAAGASLRALNDTEVLLWAYRIWGESCFERLNGMWAVAFWEPARRRLLLCRDRFGIKPLVYSVRGERVVFASEPKAVLAACPEERLPDLPRGRDFVMRRLPDPDGEGRTFFRNIHSVLAGELLCIEPQHLARRRYWQYRPGTEVCRSDAPDAFLALLRDSVRLRLRSDVPLGVTLSGGLDSSAVARIAAEQLTGPLECFSLRYEGKRFDESAYASAVANDPLRFRIHWITPSAEQLLTTMAGIVWHHDAPTPMRGRYPQWHVMQRAREFVTVLLGGQGADELLGGYDHFILPFLRDRLARALPRKPAGVPVLWELLRLGQVSSGIHRLLPPVLLASAVRQMRRVFGARLVKPRVAAAGGVPYQEAFERPYRSQLNNALWREFRYVGLPELLHAEDALSMAFSLESRLPFLDHRLVEFCFGLQYDEKVSDGWTKWLLRRSTRQLLPSAVRLRRAKLGFPADIAGWLSSGRGLDGVRELLLDPRSLQREGLERRWLQHTFGRSREQAAQWIRRNPSWTWRATTFELWCRQFIDQEHGLRAGCSVAARRSAVVGRLQVA